MPKYSIVVPFHNEEENVTQLYARLKSVMEQVGDSFELVLVDDGSNDRTYKLLEEIAAVDSRVLVVKLRRNFGQTSALAAGFDNASGEYIIAMDGDLQHDPNEIPAFIEKLEEGYDVVSRLAQGADRQFCDAADSLALRELADGQALGSGYSRLRHHLQGVSPRDHSQHSAVRRDAPVYSGAGGLVWRFDLRDSDQERDARAGQEPLRHRAHLPRLLRSADHSLPAQAHEPAAAFLWRVWVAGHCYRRLLLVCTC